MRQRTASAACRSERFSRNCSTLTVASWAGDSPGRPSRGYQVAKSSSRHKPSSRSRTHIAVVPAGLLARATRAVRGETCAPERGRNDTDSPHADERPWKPRRACPTTTPSRPRIPRSPTESLIEGFLEEYTSGAWVPTWDDRVFTEGLALGALSGARLRAALREPPAGRLGSLINQAVPIFEQTRAGPDVEKLRLALRGLLDALAPPLC